MSSNQKLKEDLRRRFVDAEDIDTSFENFPYFLSESTKKTLIASSYVRLKCDKLNFFESKLARVCPGILLSGPEGSEIYQEKLVKALAKYFGVRLFVVDTVMLTGEGDSIEKPAYTFKAGDRVMFVEVPGPTSNSRGPSYGSKGVVVLPPTKIRKDVGVKFEHEIAGGFSIGGKCDDGHGYLCTADSLQLIAEELAGDVLFELISMESQRGSLILFVKDMDKLALACTDVKEKLKALPVNVVAIASHTHVDTEKDKDKVGVIKNFPNKVTLKIPQDGPTLKEWTQKLEQDVETMKAQSNISRLRWVLSRIGFVCHDMDRLFIKDQTLSEEDAEKAIGWALTHHLTHHEDDKNDISHESIKYGIDILQGNQDEHKSLKKILEDMVKGNQYEHDLLADVIAPGKVGVGFSDIGALEHVKEMLKELVMLPLQRPEVFNKRQLIKPCKGILLFGPPGTGKTMLAKAVASESGANFINISMSSIMSKYVGDGEKYVKAAFSLARKLSPCVIFLGEADSLLRHRGAAPIGSPSELLRLSMVNEFMIQWDGFRSKDQERVLVLLATNRPFDLDEAALRRLDRRVMVGLPDALNREKILKLILPPEEVDPDVNLEAIAKMTEGYSGSDLKKLCTAAAYYPMRQFLEKDKKERALALAGNKPLSSDIRCLNMSDFKQALKQVPASVANTNELLEWNNLYGEGGCREKPCPFYIF